MARKLPTFWRKYTILRMPYWWADSSTRSCAIHDQREGRTAANHFLSLRVGFEKRARKCFEPGSRRAILRSFPFGAADRGGRNIDVRPGSCAVSGCERNIRFSGQDGIAVRLESRPG